MKLGICMVEANKKKAPLILPQKYIIEKFLVLPWTIITLTYLVVT